MAYDSTTGIITAPVAVHDVQRAVGSSQTDLGRLCTQATINKWARHKPYRGAELNYSAVGFRSAMCGLDLQAHVMTLEEAVARVWDHYAAYAEEAEAPNPPQTEWQHLPPRGAEAGEMFRLTDFNGYWARAVRPWRDVTPMSAPWTLRVLYRGQRRGLFLDVKRAEGYDAQRTVTPDDISQVGTLDLGEKYLGAAYVRLYDATGLYNPALMFVATTDYDLDLTTGWGGPIRLFDTEDDSMLDCEGLGVLFFFLTDERLRFTPWPERFNQRRVLAIDMPYYPLRLEVLEDNMVWRGADAFFEMHDALMEKYQDWMALSNRTAFRAGTEAARLAAGDEMLAYYEAAAPADLGLKVAIDVEAWETDFTQTLRYQYGTAGAWMTVTLSRALDGSSVTAAFDLYVTETQRWSVTFATQGVSRLCLTNYDRTAADPTMGAAVQVSVEDASGRLVERAPQATTVGASPYGEGYATFATQGQNATYLMKQRTELEMPSAYRLASIYVTQ